MKPERAPPSRRSDYVYFDVIQTRWADNDLYGHVNNSVYYFYIDTVINRYIIGPGGLDVHSSPIIAIVAETGCRFHRSFAYPEEIDAGLKVVRLTARAVTYQVGLFAKGEDVSRADGNFVHVYVDRVTMRPVENMGEVMHTALARLQSTGS